MQFFEQIKEIESNSIKFNVIDVINSSKAVNRTILATNLKNEDNIYIEMMLITEY